MEDAGLGAHRADHLVGFGIHAQAGEARADAVAVVVEEGMDACAEDLNEDAIVGPDDDDDNDSDCRNTSDEQGGNQAWESYLHRTRLVVRGSPQESDHFVR